LFFGTDSLSFILINKELADTVPVSLFNKYYSMLFTQHIERWNNNERSGGVLKEADASESQFRFVIKRKVRDDARSEVSSFTNECVRKVRDWQERNEEFFNVSSSSFGCHTELPRLVNSPAVIEPPVDDFAGVSALELRQMLEKQIKDKETKKSRSTRMIFMPAGGSFLDDNFISASQISGVVPMQETDDEFDSVDMVAARLGMQNI
jgi:hypothetical protein